MIHINIYIYIENTFTPCNCTTSNNFSYNAASQSKTSIFACSMYYLRMLEWNGFFVRHLREHDNLWSVLITLLYLPLAWLLFDNVLPHTFILFCHCKVIFVWSCEPCPWKTHFWTWWCDLDYWQQFYSTLFYHVLLRLLFYVSRGYACT